MAEGPGIASGSAVFRAFENASSRTVEAPVTDHVHISTGRIRKRDFFGADSDAPTSPQAFLVEDFPPNSTTGAHFHDVDQFQVFFGSPSAWYQRSAVRDTLVHYSDAYTTYGPFGTRGGAGFSFFTLRRRHAGVTAYMPGARAELVPSKPRRNRHASISQDVSIDYLPVIEPEHDGLAAHVVAAEPGEPLDVPDATGGDGQYVLVLAGTVRWRGMSLRAMSLGWVPPGCSAFLTAAGDGTASLLVLRFPRKGAEAD